MRWSATPSLRDHFFAKMRMVGYGGATLSQDIYERIQALAIAATGERIPLTTMYGATETQGVTVVHWITERVGLIGLPLPGITLKLVPNGTKLEVRVKGPTVTPGYLNRDDLTEGGVRRGRLLLARRRREVHRRERSREGPRLRRPRDGGLQARQRHLGSRRHAARRRPSPPRRR